MASGGDILAFLSLGYKTLVYIQGIHRAPKERNDLLDEIIILDTLLGQLSVVAALKQDLSPPKRDELQDLSQKFQLMLPLVQKKLRERNSLPQELWARVRWPKEKARIQDALKNLRDLISMINLQQEVAARKQVEIQRRQAEIQRKKDWFRPAVSQSLWSIRYYDGGRRGDRQRTKETGEGLLRSEQFTQWQSTTDGVLWCNGAQGSGKTMQIEAIADHLRSEDSPHHQYAVLYCHEPTLRSLETPMDIVMSFWDQLDAQSGASELHNDEETTKLYMSAPVGDRGTVMSRSDADKLKMDVICKIISNAPSTTLILDGLDEVPYNRTGDWQREVIRRLVDIQQKTGNRCRLLITSRPYNSIRHLFDNITATHYRLQVAELDLKKYIQSRIVEASWGPGNDPELIEYIHAVLVPKCREEESFLLAYFYMNEILRANNRLQLEGIIDDLPNDARGVYRRALENLADNSQQPENGLPCEAVRILYWIVFARRPLTSDELEQCLLSAYSHCTNIGGDKTAQGTSFEWLCNQLVVVASSSAEVTVRHKTVADYIMEPDTIRQIWGQDKTPNEYICEILMKYLSFECLQASSTLIKESGTLETKLPLLQYALRHWGDHFEETSNNAEIRQKVCVFLMEATQKWHETVNTVARGILAEKVTPWFRDRNNDINAGIVGPLHWAAFFNLSNSVDALSNRQRGRFSRNPVPISPLGVAAARNLPEMIQDLLDHGAHVDDANAVNGCQRPPLYDAIMHNNYNCARVLFDNGADWTVRREDSDEAVFAAIYWVEHREAAELSADYVSRSNQTSADGLQLLIQCGFTEQLQRAIDNGQDMNFPCHNGKSALDYAYELGNSEIIEVLENNGAITRLYSPLFHAIPTLMPELQALPGPESTGPSIVGQTPLVQSGKVYSSTKEVLVEVLIDQDFTFPVRSIIFETISKDQGWTSMGCEKTYLGAGVRSSFFVRIQNGHTVTEFLLQNNVRASHKFRLHTNIWNLSDLEGSFPVRAKCMKAMRPGSLVQLLVFSDSHGWTNQIRVARVRVQGQEVVA